MCLPQVLLGPFVNTFSQIDFQTKNSLLILLLNKSKDKQIKKELQKK